MNNYDFLKKVSPPTQGDYSFLSKKEPSDIIPSNARIVRLPLHLGGGEYMVAPDGGLFTSDRSQDAIGPARPGQERDHIIPVSLGGTSTKTNLQYLDSKPSLWQRVGSLFGKKTTVQQSPNRQEGKMATELDAIRAYNSGQISLDQARLQIATKQQQLLGLSPSEREKTVLGQLWKGTKDTIKDFSSSLFTDVATATIGSLDFIHRTGLHVANGIGTTASTNFVAAMKFLGDNSLKDISYDEIWAQGIEQWEQRAIDIGRPDEYFRAKLTGDDYVPMNLFLEESLEQGKQFRENQAEGDNWAATKNIANIAAMGFMRDWANPFYVFSIKGVTVGSFKLTTKGKLLSRMEINPAKRGFLIGSRVTPKQTTLRFNINQQRVFTPTGKPVKEPNIYMTLNQKADGKVIVEVRNQGGPILNTKLIQESATSKPADIIKQLGQGTKPVTPTPPNLKILNQPQPGILKDSLMTAKSTPEELLIQEAAKYKTPDDFIKAQGTPVYHGTIEKFDKFDINKAGKSTDSGMFGKGFYFTDNLKEAKTYAKRGDKIGEVKDIILDIKKPYIINSKADIPKINVPNDTIEQMRVADKEYSRLFTEKLQQQGYDGVIDNLTPGKKQYVAFSPEQIKTKSQLTDIWKQAQETPKVTPTKTTPLTEKAFSRHYDRNPYGFTDRVEFTKTTEITEKKKAFDFIQKNPERALRAGYGFDPIPENINPQVFRASLTASLHASGKDHIAREVAKVQSLELTKAGQTLVYGKLDAGDYSKVVKNVTQGRLEKLGRQLGEIRPEKQVEVAKSSVQRQTRKAADRVRAKQKPKNTKEDLKKIDDLINSIIC